MNLKRFAEVIVGILFLTFLSFNVLAQNAADNNNSGTFALEGTKVVTAQGTAIINNGDESSARNAAINDALQKAVEQAVDTIVLSQTTVEDYKLLSDKIYSNASSYVHDYKIINEGAVNNIYDVTIQATIGTKHLRDDLGAVGLLMKQKRMPRVAVIILEQNIGGKRLESALFYAPLTQYEGYTVSEVHTLHEVGDMSVAENEMMKKLLDSGFNVVDESALLKDINLVSGYGLQSLDDSTIENLGKLANVDVIIYGTAVAKLYGMVAGSEMRSAQANVSLRAVDTDDGRVLASGEQHAASVHIDTMTAGNDAIKKATDKLAESMLSSILSKWKQEANNGSLVNLIVNGVNSAGDLVVLKDQLMSTSGVQDIYERNIGNGEASMDVNYQGNAQGLVNSLLSNKTVTALFRITATTMNTISLTKK
jgi:hypothetical protein